MKATRAGTATEFIPRLFIVIGILVLPLAICTSLWESFSTYNNMPAEFCTLDDEVYQKIATNSEQWAEYFYDNPSIPTIRFSVSTNQEYIANASHWYPRDSNPQFYVQIKEAINEPFGLAGYIYNRTDILDHRYSVHLLSENIYCYQM